MNFLQILETLALYEVQFIVVGGVGAVLQGAPISTFDLDIVHATDEANITRLEAALKALDAHYRMQPERRLTPTTSHLMSAGHHNLITNRGPLDVFGSIGHGHTYESLASHILVLQIGAASIRVLDLAVLIATKEETAGNKDLAVLPILRQVLANRK